MSDFNISISVNMMTSIQFFCCCQIMIELFFVFLKVIPDPCLGTPCLNGGICQRLPGTCFGYTCSCPNGFGGVLCETSEYPQCLFPINFNSCKNLKPILSVTSCRQQLPNTWVITCHLFLQDILIDVSLMFSFVLIMIFNS